jgi:hypothetical protein
VVERLPSKHEALSSNLSTYKKQTKKPTKQSSRLGMGSLLNVVVKEELVWKYALGCHQCTDGA